MFFENLIMRNNTAAMVATASYTEARQRMIAENVANFGVPDYKTKQLDTDDFQKALAKAYEARSPQELEKTFAVDGDQVRSTGNGTVQVTPVHKPVENILFHDGTNQSLEKQMADMAENHLMHETVNSLMKDRFDSLRSAIAGRI